ncbi:unnamed protein product [Amoebophrya sp. A25]|nr:unnamed protein product [Amoebophrya sp. A25]|eukprot:GSA25T00012816001.1
MFAQTMDVRDIWSALDQVDVPADGHDAAMYDSCSDDEDEALTDRIATSSNVNVVDLNNELLLARKEGNKNCDLQHGGAARASNSTSSTAATKGTQPSSLGDNPNSYHRGILGSRDVRAENNPKVAHGEISRLRTTEQKINRLLERNLENNLARARVFERLKEKQGRKKEDASVRMQVEGEGDVDECGSVGEQASSAGASGVVPARPAEQQNKKPPLRKPRLATSKIKKPSKPKIFHSASPSCADSTSAPENDVDNSLPPENVAATTASSPRPMQQYDEALESQEADHVDAAHLPLSVVGVTPGRSEIGVGETPIGDEEETYERLHHSEESSAERCTQAAQAEEPRLEPVAEVHDLLAVSGHGLFDTPDSSADDHSNNSGCTASSTTHDNDLCTATDHMLSRASPQLRKEVATTAAENVPHDEQVAASQMHGFSLPTASFEGTVAEMDVEGGSPPTALDVVLKEHAVQEVNRAVLKSEQEETAGTATSTSNVKTSQKINIKNKNKSIQKPSQASSTPADHTAKSTAKARASSATRKKAAATPSTASSSKLEAKSEASKAKYTASRSCSPRKDSQGTKTTTPTPAKKKRVEQKVAEKQANTSLVGTHAPHPDLQEQPFMFVQQIVQPQPEVPSRLSQSACRTNAALASPPEDAQFSTVAPAKVATTVSISKPTPFSEEQLSSTTAFYHPLVAEKRGRDARRAERQQEAGKFFSDMRDRLRAFRMGMESAVAATPPVAPACLSGSVATGSISTLAQELASCSQQQEEQNVQQERKHSNLLHLDEKLIKEGTRVVNVLQKEITPSMDDIHATTTGVNSLFGGQKTNQKHLQAGEAAAPGRPPTPFFGSTAPKFDWAEELDSLKATKRAMQHAKSSSSSSNPSSANPSSAPTTSSSFFRSRHHEEAGMLKTPRSCKNLASTTKTSSGSLRSPAATNRCPPRLVLRSEMTNYNTCSGHLRVAADEADDTDVSPKPFLIRETPEHDREDDEAGTRTAASRPAKDLWAALDDEEELYVVPSSSSLQPSSASGHDTSTSAMGVSAHSCLSESAIPDHSGLPSKAEPNYTRIEGNDLHHTTTSTLTRSSASGDATSDVDQYTTSAGGASPRPRVNPRQTTPPSVTPRETNMTFTSSSSSSSSSSTHPREAHPQEAEAATTSASAVRLRERLQLSLAQLADTCDRTLLRNLKTSTNRAKMTSALVEACGAQHRDSVEKLLGKYDEIEAKSEYAGKILGGRGGFAKHNVTPNNDVLDLTGASSTSKAEHEDRSKLTSSTSSSSSATSSSPRQALHIVSEIEKSKRQIDDEIRRSGQKLKMTRNRTPRSTGTARGAPATGVGRNRSKLRPPSRLVARRAEHGDDSISGGDAGVDWSAFDDDGGGDAIHSTQTDVPGPAASEEDERNLPVDHAQGSGQTQDASSMSFVDVHRAWLAAAEQQEAGSQHGQDEIRSTSSSRTPREMNNPYNQGPLLSARRGPPQLQSLSSSSSASASSTSISRVADLEEQSASAAAAATAIMSNLITANPVTESILVTQQRNTQPRSLMSLLRQHSSAMRVDGVEEHLRTSTAGGEHDVNAGRNTSRTPPGGTTTRPASSSSTIRPSMRSRGNLLASGPTVLSQTLKTLDALTKGRVLYTTMDCAICLEVMQRGDRVTTLPCGNGRHSFHAECLKNWVLTNRVPTCPLCKEVIAPV